MRILIAAPAPTQREGGVANVVHNTAEGLRARGHQVTCLFKEDLLPRPLAFPRFSLPSALPANCVAGMLSSTSSIFMPPRASSMGCCVASDASAAYLLM
jgi:hypothetical protein